MNAERNGEAVRLENGSLEVRILPGLGGKIASLKHLANNREWLYPGGDDPGTAAPGVSFGTAQAYGFDEMFPTINEEGAYPDHGELWRYPWPLVDSTATSLTTAYQGRCFPFEFRRSLALEGNTLVLDYSVTNRAHEAMPALWTPHPLFSFEKNTRIIPPEGMEEIVQAMDGGRLGAYGGKTPVGEAQWLFSPGTVPEGTAFKFYGAAPVADGVCGIEDGRGALTMTFPKETVPWIGFWVNNGGWGGQKNLALEPATAPMDSPESAVRLGAPAEWAAGECREWRMTISIDPR